MAMIENPRKVFNFSIQIAQAPIDPFLAQKVVVPEITADIVEHGDTNHDIKTAGRVKYSTVNIEKIMTTSGADNYMFDWLYSCQDPIIGGGLIPTAYKRTITITELAEDGTSILNTWVLTGCWPSKINSMNLSRTDSDNTMESIEICVDKIEKL